MSENPLCPRVVHVCPACGWWKPQSFECEHMVQAFDGEPAFRRYRSQRVSFTLSWEPGPITAEATAMTEDHQPKE